MISWMLKYQYSPSPILTWYLYGSRCSLCSGTGNRVTVPSKYPHCGVGQRAENPNRDQESLHRSTTETLEIPGDPRHVDLDHHVRSISPRGGVTYIHRYPTARGGWRSNVHRSSVGRCVGRCERGPGVGLALKGESDILSELPELILSILAASIRATAALDFRGLYR